MNETVEPRAAGVVAALVGLTWLPYALFGPGWLADDWVFLRNAAFDGVTGAGGTRQIGRPGAEIVYGALFGIVGDHPMAAYVVLGLLRLTVALLLLVTLTEWFGRRPALIATVVWVLIPNHLSLEQWASTAPASVALILLLLGARWQVRLMRRTPRPLVWAHIGPAALVAVASVTYELVVAAAFVVAVIIPFLGRGRPAAGPAAVGWGVMLPAIAWLFTRPDVYPDSNGRISTFDVITAVFGFGFAHRSVAARLAVLVVLVGAFALLWLRRDRLLADVGVWMVSVGLLVVVLGVMPVVRFTSVVEGLDDRLNMLTSIGGALCIAGLLISVPVRVTVAAVVGIVAVAIPLRVTAADRYHDQAALAERDASGTLDQMRCRSELVLNRPFEIEHGIAGLGDGWNASAAMQLRSGQRDLTVRAPFNGFLVGPDPVPGAAPYNCG